MKKLLIFVVLGFLGKSLQAQACNCNGFMLNAVVAPIPTLSVTGTMSAFSTTTGTASAAQTVTVSGTNLTAGATITWPTGFEGSLNGTTYASTQNISLSGSNLAGQPVTVYTRLAAADAVGSYSGNVAFTSTGAATQNVAVSGTVSSAGPSRSSHFMIITIASSNVSGGSNLTNYPLTFQVTNTNLKTTGNGGFVQNSNGYDILFAADSFGTTKYNWEVENYAPTTGAITAHVKIPTLSASATTTLYIIYDSSSISTFQGGSAGSVWDANFLDVWHFNENITAASQTVHDYTSNAHNWTTGGTWTGSEQTAGQIGGALQITNGANHDYLGTTDQTLNGDYTIEGWYYFPGSGTVTTDVPFWLANDNESMYIATSNGGYFGLITGGKIQDNQQTTAGVWHYYVFTRTGTTGQMFRDGTWLTANANGISTDFQWMATGFGATNFAGGGQGIDEERISNIVRSQGWISTTYTNQSAPASFVSLSAQH